MSYQSSAVRLSEAVLAIRPFSSAIFMEAGGGGDSCDIFELSTQNPFKWGESMRDIMTAKNKQLPKLATLLCRQIIVETGHSFSNEGADIKIRLDLTKRVMHITVSSRGETHFIEKRKPIKDFPWLAKITALSSSREFYIICRYGKQSIESPLSEELSQTEHEKLISLGKMMSPESAFEEDFSDIKVTLKKNQIVAISTIMRDGPEHEFMFNF